MYISLSPDPGKSQRATSDWIIYKNGYVVPWSYSNVRGPLPKAPKERGQGASGKGGRVASTWGGLGDRRHGHRWSVTSPSWKEGSKEITSPNSLSHSGLCPLDRAPYYRQVHHGGQLPGTPSRWKRMWDASRGAGALTWRQFFYTRPGLLV